MSKYVQRCIGCRKVRGATAFRVQRGGGRVPVCRWCESSTVELRDELAALVRKQNDLLDRLTKVRRQIAHVEANLLSLVA